MKIKRQYKVKKENGLARTTLIHAESVMMCVVRSFVKTRFVLMCDRPRVKYRGPTHAQTSVIVLRKTKLNLSNRAISKLVIFANQNYKL